MSWNLGRPVFGRLPAVYRNDNDGENPSNWLTRYWDEILVEVKYRAENFYQLYLNPATAPEEWLDGMVAPMCGFTEEYYRPDWDIQIKRTLCLNAYSYIWPNRGAEHVLDWMLSLHKIPTFPEPHAYYKPEWLRVHDRVRTLTQDLPLDGTDAENMQAVADALDVTITIDGDRVAIPLTDDDWYRRDIAYAVKLHRLPFSIGYDRFFLDQSRLGETLSDAAPYEPIAVTRSRHIEGDTRLPGILKVHPFDAWIRLDPGVERDSDPWKLAQELHDLYTPIYIEGGACYDYFRVGMSAIGDPLFDPVFERAKPISLEYDAPCDTVTLFERFIAEWEFGAIVTDLGRKGTHLRFTYPAELSWRDWHDARRLVKLFSPWPGSAGWDYFRAGFSRLGDRLWSPVDDAALPIIDGWDGTETGLHLAVLEAINSPGELTGRWVRLDPLGDRVGMHWLNILVLRDRFGLDLAPCYTDITLDYSHLGEPFIAPSFMDALRAALINAGYTWEEDGARFSFPRLTDLDSVQAVIDASGANFVIPCFDYFYLDYQRLGNRLKDWLGDQILPLIATWNGTEDDLLLAALAIVGSRGELVDGQVRFSIEAANDGMQWFLIEQLRDRFGLNLTPCYTDFFLGHSHLGDRLQSPTVVEGLRSSLASAGYAWVEFGMNFAFPLRTNLDDVQAIIDESGADYVTPCFNAFALGRSRIGHPIFSWESYRGIDELRTSLSDAGYTWTEYGTRFAFPVGSDLAAIQGITQNSNAAYITPCFDAFILGSSALGHLVF